jgi:hypothetical protein
VQAEQGRVRSRALQGTRGPSYISIFHQVFVNGMSTNKILVEIMDIILRHFSNLER